MTDPKQTPKLDIERLASEQKRLQKERRKQISPSAQPPRSTLGLLEDLVKVIATIFPGVVIFITVGGFVVIHAYIAKYTELFTFDIDVRQYLVAGISLFFYLAQKAWNSQRLRLAVAIGLGLALLMVLASLLYAWWQSRSAKSANSKAFRTSVETTFDLFDKVANLGNWLIVFWLALSLIGAIVTGLTYGYTIYPQVPRWELGGQPSDVVVMFKDESSATAMPFPINELRSPHLQLLLELNNGYLLWDKDHSIVIEVARDGVQGIFNYGPTPTASSTPQLTPSAMP